jgi:hypothetical protein
MQVGPRAFALAAAVLLVPACSEYGKVLNYGAESMPQPAPNPRDLIPKNTESTPELSTGRRITEVDCSKPVDMTAGNLRCK